MKSYWLREGSRKKYDHIGFKEDLDDMLWIQSTWGWTQGHSLGSYDHRAYEIEVRVKAIFLIIWGKYTVLLILKIDWVPILMAFSFFTCVDQGSQKGKLFFLLKWNLETLVSN